MKKVIITGATGFIGGALTKKLLSMGVKVYGVDINQEKLDEMKQYGNFVPIVADFSLYEQLDLLIKERNFDSCIHTAWAGSLGGIDLYNYQLQNLNIVATCKICEAAARIDVKRFVFCSSSYSKMVTDTSHFPINYYGIAKKSASDFAMAICKKNNIECNIATLTNTYGVGDTSQKAVNTFITKLLRNESIDLIEGTKPNDWVYIDDTVEGIQFVANSPFAFKDYYIGHKNISLFRDKLIEMKQILNSTSELNFGLYNESSYVDYSYNLTKI